MHIKISVIIPTYNSEDTILDAIWSVIKQDYKNVEIVVVDDGSSDDTINLVKSEFRHDQRVVFVELKKNSGGPAKPRNIGLKIVKGDYVCFLDSDDIWHPSKLQLQLDFMIEKRLNFSSTSKYTFRAANDLNFNIEVDSGKYLKITHDLLLMKNIVVNSGVMMTKQLANRLFFSELGDHVAIEDYKAWLHLHSLPEIHSAKMKDKLVYYRSMNGSISQSKFRMAGKIFKLLNQYTVDGKKLGVKRYLYFLFYIFISIRVYFFDKLQNQKCRF